MKKFLPIILFLILSAICVSEMHAQGRKVIYLHNYDEAPYHFGFLLGMNFMDYNLITEEDYQNKEYTDFEKVKEIPNIREEGFQSYQVISIERDSTSGFMAWAPRPGFSVGVIGDLRLGKYFNFRFTPTLSLSAVNIGYTVKVNYDDTIRYYYQNNDLKKTISSRNHVNCLEFPMLFKYRSKRYNNVAAYVIAGLNPKLYFTFSNKPAKWIKTKPFDLAFEFGTGFDIYNQWFKMGIEVKMGLGMLNVLKNDQVEYFGDPLNKLKNKQLQLSLTIE